MESRRFFILLGALFALFVAVPLVREFQLPAGPFGSRVFVSGLFLVVLMSAVFAVGRTRWAARIAVSLALPAVVFQTLQTVSPAAAYDVPAHLFTIAFLGYVACLILRYLFAAERVTANTICGAICVYLLLGVFWAVVLSVVEVSQPGSFRASSGASAPAIHFGGDESSDSLYFSFVTLTTLGFGDITPVSAAAKMLVAMEAVVGQLFLAVLIARLVGLHISHSARGRRDGDER